MKISVIISFIGDPYIAWVFNKIYKKVWRDEVDEVFVLVNGVRKEIIDFIGDLWEGDDKVVKIIKIEGMLDQGHAFNRLYKEVNTDILVTMDSDNFVFQSDVINGYAQKIKDGKVDIIGTTGEHASPNIAKMLKEKYGTCRLNPFMSFWNTKIINKIKDVDFRAKWWADGEKIDYLNYTVKGKCYVDHMGELYIKARQLGARVEFIKDLKGEWYHFGAISAAARLFIKDYTTGKSIDNYTAYIERPFNNLQLLGLWYMFYKLAVDQVPFKTYNDIYYRGLKEMIQRSGRNEQEVSEIADKYKNRYWKFKEL